MVNCPHCGAEIDEGNKFCSKCGTDLTQQQKGEPQSRRKYIDERKACFGPPGSGGGLWGAISGGIFIIGIGVLWYFDLWWPGILILIGLMAIIGATLAYTRR